MLPTDRADALALYELIRTVSARDALSPAHQGCTPSSRWPGTGPSGCRRLIAAYRRMTAPAVAALEVDLAQSVRGGRRPAGAAGWRRSGRCCRSRGPTLERRRAAAAVRPADLAGAGRPDRGAAAGLRGGHRLPAGRGADHRGPVDPGADLAQRRGDHRRRRVAAGVRRDAGRGGRAGRADPAGPAAAQPGHVRGPQRRPGRRRRASSSRSRTPTTGRTRAGWSCRWRRCWPTRGWSPPPRTASRSPTICCSPGPGVRSGRFNPSSLMFRADAGAGPARLLRPGAQGRRLGVHRPDPRRPSGAQPVRHVDDGPLALIRLSDELAVARRRSGRTGCTRRGSPTARPTCAGTGGSRPGRRSRYRPADGGGPAVRRRRRTCWRGRDREPARTTWCWSATGGSRDGPVRAAVDEIRALAGAGLRVAIAAARVVPGDVPAAATRCARRSSSWSTTAVVDQVQLGDPVEAELLIVRQADGAAVRRRRAERDPAGPGAAGGRPGAGPRRRRRPAVRPDDLHPRRPAAVRGRTAVVPAGRRGPGGARRTVTLTRDDLPPIVDSAGWMRHPGRGHRGAADRRHGPVRRGGLAGRSARTRWRRSAVSPTSTSGCGCPIGRRPRPASACPRTWLVYAAADIAPRPFLHQLDFYLHFPHPQAAETLSRPALEAAAVGCVVVLPERSAALYGDAAVYCAPDGVPERDPAVPRRPGPVRRAEPPRPGRGGQGAPPAAVRGPDRRPDPLRRLCPRPVTAPRQRRYRCVAARRSCAGPGRHPAPVTRPGGRR